MSRRFMLLFALFLPTLALAGPQDISDSLGVTRKRVRVK